MERWHLWLGLLGPGAAVVIYLAVRVGNRRRAANRLLHRINETPIAALVDGEHAHVIGVAKKLNETLVSPIEQKVCLGFRSIIEQRTHPTGQLIGEWSPVWSESRCVPFLLFDGKRAAVIEGPFELGLETDRRCEVSAELPPAVFRLLERAQQSPSGRELRFRESFLLPGDRVQVMGRASVRPTDPRARHDTPRRVANGRTMRGSEERPVVVADVDVGEDDAWSA